MESRVLKSESYGSSLLVHLKDLYDRNQFCDYLLTTSTEEFHVHRLILSGVSNYFRSLLCIGGTVDDHFHVQTFDADCVQTVIHFMYTGTLVLSQANIWNILALSSQFEIPDVTELCQEFLKDLVNPGAAPTVAKESSMSALQQTTQVIASAAAKARSGGKTQVPKYKKDRGPLLGERAVVKLEPLDLMSELMETEAKPDLLQSGSAKGFSDDGYSDNEPAYECDSDVSYPSTPVSGTRGYSDRRSSRVAANRVVYTEPATLPEPGPSGVRQRGRPRKSVTQSDLDNTSFSASARKRGRPKNTEGNSQANDTPPPRKKSRTSSAFLKWTPKPVVKKAEIGARSPVSIPKLAKKYACTLCSKIFMHLASLLLHKKSCHFAEGHKTKGHQHSLSWARNIQLANSRCQSTTPGVFICTICKNVVNSRQRLAAHIMKRHPKRTCAHKCSTCDPAKTFHSPKHLFSHRHRRHRHKTLGVAASREHLHKCLFCNRVFMYMTSFQQHQAAVHSVLAAVPELVWQCSVDGCEVSGTTHLAYMQHMVQTHPGAQFDVRKPTRR